VTPPVAQRSSRRTPATGNTKSLSGRSAAESQGDGKHEITTGGGARSTRKRKLATMFEDAGPTTEEVGSQLSQPSLAVDSALRTELSPGEASVIAAGDNSGLEDSILSTARSSKKRKKRKSIGQNFRKRARASLLVTNATDTFVSPLSVSSSKNQQEDEASGPQAEPNLSMKQPVVQPESGSTFKVKRKKRKSIGKLPKVKRKSLTIASPSAPNVQGTATTTEGESSMQQENTSSTPRQKPRKVMAPVEEVSEDDFDEELSSATRPGHQTQPADDVILSSAQTSRPGRPRTSDVSVTAPRSKKGPKPLSARPKPPKRTTQPRNSSPLSDPPDRRPRKEKPGTIPITVHRLSRPKPLDHSSADEDILATSNPFPKRSGVNAIDVLSQICREMVAKAAENLKLGEAKERGERKKVEARKRKAVEMFGEELDARLFQMTEALDNNYALTIRLRQANKEKVVKREELLEIKRLREEVAIETDEVRAKHERDSKVAQVSPHSDYTYLVSSFRPPIEDG